jgi:hypothetical protein
MHLHSHHPFHEFAEARREPNPKLSVVRVDDWSARHFGDTSPSRRQSCFAGI